MGSVFFYTPCMQLAVREQYINIKIVKLSSPSKINNICVSGKDNGLSSVARTEKVNRFCILHKHANYHFHLGSQDN